MVLPNSCLLEVCWPIRQSHSIPRVGGLGLGGAWLQRISALLICMLFLCLPPSGSVDILFFPVRLSVRPYVRLSVPHKSCPLYNLKTVKDFSMELGTLVNQCETMCHAQEP